MRRLVLVALLAGCGASAASPDGGRVDGGTRVTRTFAPSTEDFPNPERGLYDDVDLVAGGDWSSIYASGMTLAYAHVRLDAYRNAPLPDSLLTSLRSGFADVRAAGLKVILRFVYNDAMDADAPLDVILGHIGQLAPVLVDNADVIAVWQAGFIGAWGEWHDSTNGNDTPAARKAVLDAELAALPARMLQVRTPMFKAEAYGGPLDDAHAWDGSGLARVGHHDDCFLASDSDFGTYADPIETWKDFVAAEGRFTPVGGETCAVDPPRSECASATAEMARLHWSFLNSLYHPDVLAGFSAGGCLPTIRTSLGYRLVLVDETVNERVRPGGVLRLTVHLQNVGWATMFDARPVWVVLDGPTRLGARLPDDPRRWSGAVTLDAVVRVPTSIAPGTYRLALWLPDASPSISARPEYAVRFANDGVWDATLGDDGLTTVTVDASAPPDDDPSAIDLAPL